MSTSFPCPARAVARCSRRIPSSRSRPTTVTGSSGDGDVLMVYLESCTALAGTLESACWGESDLGRCPLRACLVRSRLIIEHKVCAQPLPCLAGARVIAQIDLLILHRAPQPLDKDVVQRPSLAVHANLH